MKKLLLVSLVLLSSAGLQAGGLEWLEKANEQGYLVEANGFFKATGVPVHFREHTFGRLRSASKSGDVQLAIYNFEAAIEDLQQRVRALEGV